MNPSEQEYAKSSFNDVAEQYDQIEFFKTSAQTVASIIENRYSQKSLNILDVASGTGNVALECAKRLKHSTLHGIDISEDMLNKAKHNAESEQINNITFSVVDITELEIDQKYHVITCSYALFFLPNPEVVLAKLFSILKDSGIIIFTSFTQDAFSPTKQTILSLLRKFGSNSALAY